MNQTDCKGEVWNGPRGVESPGPSSLISVAWEMDTAQASLRRGADLPVVALRSSVCTGCSWQGRPRACAQGWARAGAGCEFSQTVLGRRKEGKVVAKKKMWRWKFSSWIFCLQGVEMLGRH